MATPAPFPLVISESIHLVDLIQYVLKQNAHVSTLVICSTQEQFLQRLQSRNGNELGDNEENLSAPSRPGLSRSQLDQWTNPTLRFLASSHRISFAFCPDVTHLRAYLAKYGFRDKADSTEAALLAPPMLVIVNPINVHRPSSAFSAQGLNRTFAIAIEAAARTRSRLVLAECTLETDDEVQNVPYDDEELHNRTTDSEANPWNEEVSILNVTTKAFGAGERGWVGRTVKIRAIAERWCRFETLIGGNA